MYDLFQAGHLPMMAFISLASLGLVISVTVEHVQLIAKYRGVLRQRVAGGYNSAMKIMVVSRFGAVLYFLLISISIDLGMTPETISKFFAVAILMISLFDLSVAAAFFKRNKLQIKSFFANNLSFTPVFMSMVASFFGILGLTLPMLLSSANPALRLTMANLGFVLNSIFTILVVFFVENYLAELIDDPRKQHNMTLFVTAVFAMRFLGTIVATFLILLLSMNVDWLKLT